MCFQQGGTGVVFLWKKGSFSGNRRNSWSKKYLITSSTFPSDCLHCQHKFVSIGLVRQVNYRRYVNTTMLMCAWAQVSLERSAKDKWKFELSENSAACRQKKACDTKKMLEMRKGWPNQWQHGFFFLQIVLCIENSSTYAHSATNASVEKCNSESTRFVNAFYGDSCHIAPGKNMRIYSLIVN